jgi:hypothetical protein
MAETLESLNMRTAQQGQIIDQYRVNIYNTELRFELLVKMLEEKGIFVKGEFEKRWPLYLKSEIGVIGEGGVMSGSMRTTFYGEVK